MFYVPKSYVLCFIRISSIKTKARLHHNCLKMPVNLNQYRETTGIFNASIIMIKIKSRSISRLHYFRNTNQVSINIRFFLVLLFSLLLHYFSQKNPKSHSSVPVYLFAHYTEQFSGCAS